MKKEDIKDAINHLSELSGKESSFDPNATIEIPIVNLNKGVIQTTNRIHLHTKNSRNYSEVSVTDDEYELNSVNFDNNLPEKIEKALNVFNKIDVKLFHLPAYSFLCGLISGNDIIVVSVFDEKDFKELERFTLEAFNARLVTTERIQGLIIGSK